MHIDNARELKATLWRSVCDEVTIESERPAVSGFLGLSVRGPGRYGVAVRYRDESGAALARRALELGGDEVDVREVGAVRHLAVQPGPEAAEQSRWQPEELRRRVRPLHPGLSIAHRDVSAGTLGGFVTLADARGVFVLSNSHVMADSGRGSVGDPVLQPGPADGGVVASDTIGVLARALPLSLTEANSVDAAVARLQGGGGRSRVDEAAVDSRYPAGPLKGWAEVTDEVVVEKVGRTTGITRGRVTAIEVDAVTVEYPIGPVTFDDQIEIAGADGAFSSGGDSGSLVYRPDTLEAVGLLFAGSERGATNGSGLTYCNAMGLVLSSLGATLVT